MYAISKFQVPIEKGEDFEDERKQDQRAVSIFGLLTTMLSKTTQNV